MNRHRRLGIVSVTVYPLRLRHWLRILVLAMLSFAPVFATAGEIHDVRGTLVVHISATGEVHNAQGVHLGRFRTDGTYVDPRGVAIVILDRNGAVHEPNGRRIATFGHDDVLRDRRGVTIGRIDSQGSISDRQGRRLATTHDISSSWVAIYWFLLR